MAIYISNACVWFEVRWVSLFVEYGMLEIILVLECMYSASWIFQVIHGALRQIVTMRHLSVWQYSSIKMDIYNFSFSKAMQMQKERRTTISLKWAKFSTCWDILLRYIFVNSTSIFHQMLNSEIDISYKLQNDFAIIDMNKNIIKL